MNSTIRILGGNSNKTLTQSICSLLGTTPGEAKVSTFSDGETAVEINESIRGKDIFIVQSTCPPTNEHLMELLVMLDAVKRASACRIAAVIPYFGYARQDRKATGRTPISAKLVANLLAVAGAHRVLTVDLHAGQIQGFFSIPGDVLYAFHILIGYLHELVSNMHKPVLVSPDLGFAKKARNYAAKLDIPLAFIEKRRASNDPIAKALTLIGDVEGSDCIILDEEISTASTIITAVNLVKEYGARDITLVFIHPVLAPGAVERLVALPVKQFITTDTIPISPEQKALFGDRLKVVSVAQLLAEVILRGNQGRSVGELFNE